MMTSATAPVGLSLGASTKLLPVLNNQQIEDRHQQEAERVASLARQERMASFLAGHVRSCFVDAEEHKRKTGIAERLIDAQRRRRGQYEPRKLAEIQELGGSALYSKDTELKCNAAEAIITDVIMPFGDEAWGLSPTPIPDLPDGLRDEIHRAVMQKMVQEVIATGALPDEQAVYEYAKGLREDLEAELRETARERCDAMRDTMRDQLAEMAWQTVFDDFRSNAVTFGTGFVKGPIVVQKKRGGWQGADYIVQKGLALSMSAPSPLDMYPSKNSLECEDGYVIERTRIEPPTLAKMLGAPYCQDTEIKELLEFHPTGLAEILPDDQTRSSSELRPDPNSKPGYYEVLEFWGPISGRLLNEYGMPGLAPTDFYDVQVLLCGNRVLKVMPNPDPLGRPPYFKCCYKRVVGSFWGQGIPHLIADSQDLANNCIRAIANNMAMSSGPMVAVDTARLPPGTDIESLHPWQLFQFSNPSGVTTPPIHFFQPDSHVQELMAVYAQAVRKMDDESGLPAYQYGNERVAGAGRTSSGLSMLMSASARGIKEAMVQFDLRVIEPFMQRLFFWNMLYNPDDSIKGDAQIVTYGAARILSLEMKQGQISELLQETANPIDLQILGIDGRTALLKARVDMIDKDLSRKVVPNVDRVRRLSAAMDEQQPDMLAAAGGRNNQGSAKRQ